jgi:hypothetical protein
MTSDRTRGESALSYIEEALRGLQFGQVTVIVQDGVVVQVERTERRRIQRRKPAGEPGASAPGASRD